MALSQVLAVRHARLLLILMCASHQEGEEIALRAASAVGGGVLGVDLMEDEQRGLLVHEINNTVEFRGASNVSTIDIASAIIDYSVTVVKR